jgi:hypothetical protein
MNVIKSSVIVLSIFSIMPLCAMENEKNNVISDAKLLAKKKAFALELKNRQKSECEFLYYPKGSNIKVDLEVLNQELELSSEIGKVIQIGDMFIIPAGMNEKFIHKTLVPDRVPDFEVTLV